MAARAIWRGALSFGSVSIPVKLYTATRSNDISFNLLHQKDEARIRMARVCSEEEDEVPSEEIVRGFEYEKDQYVIVTDEDLKALPLPTKRTVEVSQFVPADAVDPIYYEKSYYLLPEPVGEKAFSMLLRLIQDKGLQGIGKVAIREKERLCAIRADDGVLMLATMRYPDEVDLSPSPPPQANVSDAELQMAFALIDMLHKPFQPEDYQDTYREALLELIRAKLEGRELPEERSTPATEEVDLVAALKASVEALKLARENGEPPEETGTKPRRRPSRAKA
ncbi:MAG: Ku protein [Dehalococcoidia bacterium]